MSQWWFRVIVSGGMLCALGCAAHSTAIQTAVPTDPQIRLHVESPPEGVQLVIDADSPLVYTAFRLPDPPRLVLDLAGVSLDPNQQPISVDHGAVTTIRPIPGTAGSHGSRIEVGLTQLVDYQLRPNGSKLLVTFASPAPSAETTAMAAPAAVVPDPPAEEAKSAPASSPVPSQPESTDAAPAMSTPQASPSDPPVSSVADAQSTVAAKPEQPETADQPVTTDPTPSVPSAPPAQEPDATTVTAIHVNHDGSGLVIDIDGNGRFHPETMLLKGPRLVIDLPGTTARLQSRFPVNEALLKQIRVGTHQTPRKVRVVFDLTKPVSYDVTQAGGTLKVSLSASKTSGVSADTGPRPMEPAAAPEAVATADPTTPAATTAPVAPAAAPEAKPPQPAALPPVKSKKEVALPPPSLPKKSVQSQMSSSGPASNGAAEGSAVGPKQFSGRLISLDFQDADLDNVLRLMADVSGLNIVVGQGVKGKVTVKLLNVPWDQALDLILRTHGLGQVREGNILRIDTLANLSKQQDEEAKAKDSAAKAEDLITRVMYVNYAEAKKLSTTLNKHLSPRGEMTIDERTNALIVKDIKKNVDEIMALLKVLDTKTPQVLIEARIVSADTNFARDLGVQWGYTVNGTSGPFQLGSVSGPSGGLYTGTPGTPAPGFMVNLPASGQAGSQGSVGFTLGKLTGTPFTLDLRLSAGENQGVSKTISSPKVLVLDNQKAKIEQGTSVPFSTTSQQGTQTTFVEASLTLEVTPHVTPDGSILMELRVANNEPDYANANPLVGPPIKKKEAITSIMVKDGDTVVLGGIYISNNSDSTSGLPWLNKIPLLGWLFKQTSTSSSKNELLLFLTPKIVT